LPLTYKLNLLTFILPSRAYFAYPATTFGLPGDHFRPTRQSPLGLPGDHLRPTRQSPLGLPGDHLRPTRQSPTAYPAITSGLPGRIGLPLQVISIVLCTTALYNSL